MKIDLNEVAKEIREILEKRRLELDLTFVEDTHTYYMKDLDGKVRDNYPSVSKVMKYFYEEFDSEGISLRKAKGDPEVQQQLLDEWKAAGGGCTHRHLKQSAAEERVSVPVEEEGEGDESCCCGQ